MKEELIKLIEQFLKETEVYRIDYSLPFEPVREPTLNDFINWLLNQ